MTFVHETRFTQRNDGTTAVRGRLKATMMTRCDGGTRARR